MNAWLSNASLLLYPQSPTWSTSEFSLVRALSEIGFTGSSLKQGRYYVGEHFLEHIAFLGCSPNIRLAPEAKNERFSHIRIHAYTSITALIGKHARPPSCRHCNGALDYSQGQLDRLSADTLWTCPHCQHLAAPWQYRWRKNAAFACIFIEITEIYPQEAIPQDSLLEALHENTDIKWHHSYWF